MAFHNADSVKPKKNKQQRNATADDSSGVHRFMLPVRLVNELGTCSTRVACYIRCNIYTSIHNITREHMRTFMCGVLYGCRYTSVCMLCTLFLSRMHCIQPIITLTRSEQTKYNSFVCTSRRPLWLRLLPVQLPPCVLPPLLMLCAAAGHLVMTQHI